VIRAREIFSPQIVQILDPSIELQGKFRKESIMPKKIKTCSYIRAGLFFYVEYIFLFIEIIIRITEPTTIRPRAMAPAIKIVSDP